MKDKISVSSFPKGDPDKFVKLIDETSKMSQESGLLDLDYLDLIPEYEFIDEPIPLPFGGHGGFGKWNSE